MRIDLYYAPGSPPCRVVLLLGKALGLNFNLKPISVQAKENMTPEYLKINPQHCIPTIVDNGLNLWESRAILTYLADRYGKDDSLYPKNLKKRALVDQRLYFDMGTLVPSIKEYFAKQILGKQLEADDLTKLENAYELLDKFLEGEEWVAGSNITVADYAIVVNVSVTEAYGSQGLGFDISKYHNVTRWLSNAKKTMVGFSEIEGKGNEELKKRVDALRAQKNFFRLISFYLVSFSFCHALSSIKCYKIAQIQRLETVVGASSKQLTKMTIDLYYAPGSPPCRVVLLLGKALGLNFNLKAISVRAKENFTPEYLKINPQHCIPTIVDNGLNLWESRAILTYLADRYGKDDSLYPKDLKKRALVDQRLYFDIGTLVPSIRQYFLKQIFGRKLEADDITKLENAFELLDKFLEGEEWVAGSNITVADYAIVVNVSITEAYGLQGLGFDISKYHNVTRWLSKAKKTMVGFSEIEGKGNEELKKWIDSVKAQKN
ncbi:uncharacterized protein [Periplaneta americana]|uniref:uncharacterized protein n=1 Tax=Periplaneta americana TaxID=6978 RepID=UPI0037E71F87